MIEFYQKKIDSVDYLPVMPTVLNKLLEVLNDNTISNKELAKIISLDATVSAKILSIANSALFGGNVAITDLTSAVTRLGMVDVKTIAMTLYVSNMLKRFKIKNIRIEDYWRHNLAVAFIARKISQFCQPVIKVDEAMKNKLYLIGLFHDIGYILFDQVNPETFLAVKDKAISNKESFVDLENLIIETNHAHEGADLLKYWKLPEILYESVRYHHEPITCPNNEYRTYANVINVADYLANINEFTMIKEMAYETLSENAWKMFTFSEYDEEKFNLFKAELEQQARLFISFSELALSV